MVRCLCSLIAGLLLFASEHPLTLWPLQLIAFVPLLWSLREQHRRGGLLWTHGVLFVIGYVAPVLLFAGVSPPVLAVAVAFVVQWIVLAMVIGRYIDRGFVLGPALVAATVTLVEIALWHLVPIFGHGQCFARPLAWAPWLVAFAGYTGLGGVVFTLLFTQGLALGAMNPKTRVLALAALVGCVLLLAALNFARWSRPLGEPVRIAVAGRTNLPNTFEAAAQANAQLLVTPETGLQVGNRETSLARIAGLARTHGIAATVGVWYSPDQDNRAWTVDPTGELVGEYTKTHLIPWLENYNPGDGGLATAELMGGVVGTMICQDDNFTDLSREYSLEGARLLAVPSNDWPAVAELHFENSLWRSIECGFAVARATSNGISALVSPRGEVVSMMPWPTGNKEILIDQVALGDGVPTIYARLGDWPMLLLSLSVLVASLRFPAPSRSFGEEMPRDDSPP